jgi:arylsulfate sulfotransferase
MGRHAPTKTELTRHTRRRPLLPGLGKAAAILAIALVLLGVWTATTVSRAASVGLTVKANLPSGQPVGVQMTWTATSSGLKSPLYRFSVGPLHGPSAVVRDFSRTPSFAWTPPHEGAYQVQATVKDGFGTTSTVTTTSFTAVSRVTGQSPVVGATANPLVALYSAPPCAGGMLAVQFKPAAGSAPWQATTPHPCVSGQSVNVLVAGMRASTRYVLQSVITTNGKRATSAPQSFTTGKPPTGLRIATFNAKMPATAQADLTLPMIFHALNPDPSPTLANPIATDLSGNLVWYYDSLHSGLGAIWPVHILSGGTLLLFGRDRYHATGDNVLREVDLAGNTVRETNIDAVDAQLAARGQEPIYMFHHEAIRLPNGYTAVLGATQKKLRGHDVMSDMVVVLDTNFQVTWTWDMFDHFTPPAAFPAGTPTCAKTGPTLCALPDPNALDWTHGNSIGWSAPDADLTVSFRDISFMIKVDYRDGHGTGKVLWRLGKGGDFTLKSTDAYPWFSHQHNAYFVDSTTVIAFDNANARCQDLKLKDCQSRGQVYKLDEAHRTATLVFNADLGGFWQALGSAQLMPGGNLTFAGGFAPPSKVVEFRPDGTKVFELDASLAEYRAYRLTALSY